MQASEPIYGIRVMAIDDTRKHLNFCPKQPMLLKFGIRSTEPNTTQMTSKSNDLYRQQGFEIGLYRSFGTTLRLLASGTRTASALCREVPSTRGAIRNLDFLSEILAEQCLWLFENARIKRAFLQRSHRSAARLPSLPVPSGSKVLVLLSLAVTF